ncbi:hypothetical protein BHE74_00049150 [Ensete ventricosum]|nr:hypothetical protein GW17_00004190 [Ensete ventricosum]RWW45040.1 hypothetical protein BHE74_00049150 [Ensete ventricosum]
MMLPCSIVRKCFHVIDSAKFSSVVCDTCVGPSFVKKAWCNPRILSTERIPILCVHCSASESKPKTSSKRIYEAFTLSGRRTVIGMVLVTSVFGLSVVGSHGAGLPPEEKPRLCDEECEKELENVWWLQIMLPWFHQGKYLTARWKKANLIFSVWELVRYNNLIVFPIFAPNLSFPKGLTSAPGRPRVAPNSPVIFDVSLEYIPGLDDE